MSESKKSVQDQLLEVILKSGLSHLQVEEMLGIKISEQDNVFDIKINTQLMPLVEDVLKTIIPKSFIFRRASPSENKRLKIVTKMDNTLKFKLRKDGYWINDIIAMYLKFKTSGLVSFNKKELKLIGDFMRKYRLNQTAFAEMTNLPYDDLEKMLLDRMPLENKVKEQVFNIINAEPRCFSEKEKNIVKSRIRGGASERIELCNSISLSYSMLNSFIYSTKKKENPYIIEKIIKDILSLPDLTDDTVCFTYEEKTILKNVFTGTVKEKEIICNKLGVKFNTIKAYLYDNLKIKTHKKKKLFDKINKYKKSLEEKVSLTKEEVKILKQFKSQFKLLNSDLSRIIDIPMDKISGLLARKIKMTAYDIIQIMEKVEEYKKEALIEKPNETKDMRSFKAEEIDLIESFKKNNNISQQKLTDITGIPVSTLSHYLNGRPLYKEKITQIMDKIKNPSVLEEVMPIDVDFSIHEKESEYDKAVKILKQKEEIQQGFQAKINEKKKELEEMEKVYNALYGTVN